MSILLQLLVLHSKLNRLFHLSYLVDQPAANGLNEIIKSLEAGQHIILSFGEHENDLDYLLVTNLADQTHPREMGGFNQHAPQPSGKSSRTPSAGDRP